MLNDLIEIFQALPTLGKVGVALGIITPLLVLNAYLNPPKPPPAPPPPQKFSVSGDVTLQDKSKGGGK